MFESLHNHTTSSDGAESYHEVLASARDSRCQVVAFTDHDVLPSAKDMKALEAYDGSVQWLVGCEISSGMPKEIGRDKASCHILGLFTDPTNAGLSEHCRLALEARTERMESVVANLKNLGFIISVDDVLAEAGGDSIGRPHMVRALARHPENGIKQEALRAQMEVAAKTDSALAVQYARMMSRPVAEHAYHLFLSDDAFIPGVDVDYKYMIDLDHAVELIRGAGGIAVIAHWYTASKYLPLSKLEELLADGRLDGIELMGNPTNPAALEAAPQLETLASRTGAATTYGVDSHRDLDFFSFAQEREWADRSRGQTDVLIERYQPDLTFSNLAR